MSRHMISTTVDSASSSPFVFLHLVFIIHIKFISSPILKTRKTIINENGIMKRLGSAFGGGAAGGAGVGDGGGGIGY